MPEDNEPPIPPSPITPQYASNEKIEKINVSDEIKNSFSITRCQ
jgi:hypothetical protein